MEQNILIVGVGGQGTLLASRVLGKYADLVNLDCKLSEVHGMAQRGGSVVTHVRMGEKLHSPLVEEGRADVVLAFEELEAIRWAHYLKPEGAIIVNRQQIMPMPVVTGAAAYPESILVRLAKTVRQVVPVSAAELARQAGSIRTVNTVMLAQLCKYLKLDKEKFAAALISSVPEKSLDVNARAFEAGFEA